MFRSRLRFAPVLAAATLTLGAFAVCPAQAQFVGTNFQTIDPPFAFPAAGNPYDTVSLAYGISNNGTIVGLYTDTDSPTIPSQRGYILQNGNYTSVSFPAQAGTLNNTTSLFSINNAGVSTGSYEVYDVNTGDLVSTTGFIRSSSGVFSMPMVATPGATNTLFAGINDAGLVAAQYTLNGARHSAVFNTNTNAFTFLPDAATNTLLQFVGSNGDLVGNLNNGGAFSGFIYRNGAYTTFNAPSATDTRFNGINTAGIVSGRYRDSNGLSHGLLYNSNNGFFSTFDVPGATQTFLYQGSINDSNQISGAYNDQNGVTHSFSATAVAAPEPSALGLLTTGASLLGSTVLVRRRRRSKCAI